MKIYYWFLFLTICIQLFGDKKTERGLKKSNRNTALFAFVGLVCIMGLKAYIVGTDTRNYMYRYSVAESMIKYKDNSEYGYILLSYFFKKILGFNWQAFSFVMYAFMSVVLVRFFYKYSKSVGVSVLLFVTIGNFTMYLSGIRQSIAISVCLAAYMILMSNIKALMKYIIFSIMVLIAASIHNSALIFFIVPFFYKRELSKKAVFAVIAIAAGALFYRNLVVELFKLLSPERYVNKDFYMSDYQMNYLLIVIAILIPVFCNIINDNYDYKRKKYDQLTSTMFVMSALQIFFCIMIQNNNQLGRLGYYFITSQSILIPNSMVSLKDTGERTIAYFVIFVLCLTMFVMSSTGGTLHIDNYRFFWQTYLY